MDKSNGKSYLKIGSAVLRIPNLLYKLGMALNNKQFKLNFRMDHGQPEPTFNLKPEDFRDLFRQMHASNDEFLLEYRYKLFLHLYRLLVKLEPKEAMRQKYLLFCYYLFDEKEPARLQQEDRMLCREKLTETLIHLAQNLLHMNEITLAGKAVSEACKIGFALVERRPAVMKSSEAKGFRWDCAGSVTISIKGRSKIPLRSVKSKIEPKQGKPKQSKIPLSSSSSTIQKKSSQKETAEVGCQFMQLSESLDKSKCQLQRIRETAEFGCQFMAAERRRVSNMAQQTDISRAVLDRSVQTCCSSSCSKHSLTNAIVREMRDTELKNYIKYGDLSELTRVISPSNMNSHEQTYPLGERWAHFLLSTSEEMLANFVYPSTEFSMPSEERLPKINQPLICADMPSTSDRPDEVRCNVLVLPTVEHEEWMEQMNIEPTRAQQMNQSEHLKLEAHSEKGVEGLRPQLKLLAKSLLARERSPLAEPEQREPISMAWQQDQGCADSSVISEGDPSEVRSTQNILSRFGVSELLIDNQAKDVNQRSISLEMSLRVLQRTMDMLTKMQPSTELHGDDTPINPSISITADNTQLEIRELSTADSSDADQKVTKEVGNAGTPSMIDDKSVVIHKAIEPIIEQPMPSNVSVCNINQYIVNVLQQTMNDMERSSSSVSNPHSQLSLAASIDKSNDQEELDSDQSEADGAIRPQSTFLVASYNAEAHLKDSLVYLGVTTEEPITLRSDELLEPESPLTELPSSNISEELARGTSHSSPRLDVLYDCQSFRPVVIPAHVKWEHRRYIIVSSHFIIKQFKCNPAYQCSLLQPEGPNFYEQWCQFQEIAAESPLLKIKVPAIRKRLRSYLRRISKQYALQNPNKFVAVIAQCQLRHLLSEDELQEYDAMRWQLRDQGQIVALTPEQCIEAAVSAMLGQPSQQLRASALGPRLMLRSPQHQQSVSESYLLLALAEVGFYFTCLQYRQQELLQLGDCSSALAPCLLIELLEYSQFCQRQRTQATSLIRLFWQTRCYLYRFRWMLKLLSGPSQQPLLLHRLQMQIGLGDTENEVLVKQWLQRATEPLLAKLSRWLLLSELPTGEFFIVRHEENPLENYWHHEFEVVPEEVPQFVEMHQAQRLLIAGRNCHYSRLYLDLELELPVPQSDLQWRLSEACAKSYGEWDKQPLDDLVKYMDLYTSRQLFEQLENLCPQPMQLFSQLYQYLMLTDVEFVRELIELLEPALEQPAEYFSASLMNNMLEELQDNENERLYVARGSGQGSRCWCYFVLRWHHVRHWLPLIGDCQPLYESCFGSLWQLHYADYVLNERISRQQSHIWERIDLEHFQDVRMVRDRFDEIIDRLQGFILSMRRFILEGVLAREYENFYFRCRDVDSLHVLLELHHGYLRNIRRKLWLIGDWSSQLRLLLQTLYDPIIQLDEVQQNFLSLCQFFKEDDVTDLRWSCQNTLDAINDLDNKFQKGFINFLLALHDTEKPQLIALAKVLAANEFGNKQNEP